MCKGGLDGDNMFVRPIFTRILKNRAVFFKRLRQGGLGITGAGPEFNSTSYYKPHEKQMPDNLVAIVCASVSTCAASIES